MTYTAPFDPIAFIDLAAQRRRIGARMDEAILRVVDHGGYIMGPEVRTLERKLSEFCGAPEVISCANGTDALSLILMAKGIGRGDAVVCPSFTFAATAEVVALTGATPVFADIDPESYNLDPASLKSAIAAAQASGLEPKAVIAVDLFGQPADYDAIEAIAAESGLWLLDDAAQGFGARYKSRKIGAIGLATATSFFPAKPLGCYGDGGAIMTADPELAAIIRSLRIHGQGADKYDNVRIGMNGRLDTMQAAVLLEKLAVFPEEIEARNRIAERYTRALGDAVATPAVMPGSTSVWAQYTIRVPAERRDAIAAGLKKRSVPTAIYYPRPLHRQTAYAQFPVAGNGLPVSERVAQEVLSLPMHPYLEEAVQDYIISAVRDAVSA